MDKKFEKLASAPSVALEKALDATKNLEKKALQLQQVKRARSFWASLGPGLVTGAADDDPAGIATYSQAGAKYGFQFLWLSLFTLPLMAIVQEMCARIGLTTGRGLAGNIRIYYPKWVLYTCAFLLFFANTFNIGADIGAMAASVQLLFPQLPFLLACLGFTLFCLLLQIFMPYEKYARYLKYLVFVLFAYVATAFLVGLDVQQVMHATFLPSFSWTKEQLFIITAILGTTISPYLFFWQTSHEVEEEIFHGKTNLRLRENTTDAEIRKMRIDVWTGMFLSNLVMYFIIATCAAVLFTNGITTIDSAADAAAALRPLAGEYAFLLFAFGIIGTGFLAIPVLAGATAYTMAESFKWRSGLYRKLHQARAFYGIIILSMLLGFSINFFGINPITMLIVSAVINALVSPLILFLIVQMTSNPKIVKNRVNSHITAALGWYITGIMALTGIATVVAFILG